MSAAADEGGGHCDAAVATACQDKLTVPSGTDKKEMCTFLQGWMKCVPGEKVGKGLPSCLANCLFSMPLTLLLLRNDSA